MSKVKTYTLLFILYLFLSLIFTWPLAQSLSTRGFGYDEDSPYHIWHNWWLKYSVFDLKQNPLHTDYIFYPQKINLIYDANAFVFAAFTLPIQFLTDNAVLASNIILLFSLVLSGIFAFLLADYLLKNKPLAFLCGLIFAFNPYTFAQALDGHTNLISTWMIPLYTLFLLKAVNSEGRWRFSAAAGVVAALQLYNDFTYTSFFIIETGLIVAFYLAAALFRKNLRRARSIFLSTLFIGAITALLSFPVLAEVYKASQSGFRPGSPIWVQNIWATDLLTFVRPNDHSTFLKNPWTPNIGTVEGTAFIGYTVLALLLLYFLIRIVKKYPIQLEENLMLFLSISFFLLMLGPSIHYKNNFQFPVFNTRFIFPLPYLLLHKIPFVGETQEPGRMFPFFILPLSIIAAFTLKRVITSLPDWIRVALPAGVFLLLVFEYLSVPFPTTDLSGKPIFDIIKKDPGKQAVLVLPLGFNSGNYALGASPIGSLQFYQVYFQKPAFRGTVARLPYSTFEYYQKLPLISYFIDPKQSLDEASLNRTEQQKLFKEQLNIKYIVVVENKYKGPMGQTYEVIENILGAKKFYDQGGIRGYIL